MTPDDVEHELLREIEVLRAELKQNEQMAALGALSSSITHEFNNVLTTVINYAKMGLRHEDAATREKAFTKILAAGQRAAEITTGMLALARGESSRKEPARLGQLVQQVAVLTEKELRNHRVELHLNLMSGGEEPWAAVQPALIQQVLLNLIINGRQAIGEGGTIVVSTAVGDDFGEISVRDTGCGIPAEDLERIFETRFSTKTADADGRGGSGLGLSTCREIVEDHGGRIRVRSEVGKGTEFTVRLPLATALASA